MKNRILFVFRRQRAERLFQWKDKNGPDEMLYGFNYFSSKHYETKFIEGDDAKFSLIRRVVYFLEKWIGDNLGIGFALHIALENIATLNWSDVIICTVDTCGLPVLCLKHLGLIKSPIVYISQGLSDRISSLSRKTLTYKLFKNFYQTLLQSADVILVLGEGARTHILEVFDLNEDTVSCIQFGIDSSFWFPHPSSNPPHGDFVLSVGSDQARDYPTLLTALPNETHLKIVTRLPIPKEVLGDHVEVGTQFSDLELKQLYQQAYCVVTPLKDVYQPSGQSATLQAMACGKAVILTKTKGIWDSEHIKHRENCYLVSPNSPSELKRAIEFLKAHPHETMRLGHNARKTVEQHYSSVCFSKKLENIVSSLA